MKTSITVTWSPPKNQSIMVKGYTIGYGMGIPDVYKKLVDGKQRYFTIEGLGEFIFTLCRSTILFGHCTDSSWPSIAEPNAEYVISLRAYNGMGDGRPIYEHVRTRGDDTTESASPITPPLGVKAIVHSENTVVLYWTDSTLPSDQVWFFAAGSPLFPFTIALNATFPLFQVTDNRYYTIRYTSHPQSPRYKFRNTTELNYMIDDLKPYTRYEFSVKVTKVRIVPALLSLCPTGSEIELKLLFLPGIAREPMEPCCSQHNRWSPTRIPTPRSHYCSIRHQPWYGICQLATSKDP